MIALLLLLTAAPATARAREVDRNVTRKRAQCFDASATFDAWPATTTPATPPPSAAPFEDVCLAERPGTRCVRRVASDARRCWASVKCRRAENAEPFCERDGLRCAMIEGGKRCWASDRCRRRLQPTCGRPLDMSKPVPLWCAAHRLRLPAKHGRSVLCVPQKNGNRDFMLLLYALYYGAPPESSAAMDYALGVTATSASGKRPLSFSTVDAGDDVYFVSRNPFARLLSLYLDKVLRCFHVGDRDPEAAPGAHCSHDLLKLSGAFDGFEPRRRPRDAPSFPRFVALVDNATRTRDLCALDHHLCTQVSGCALSGAKSVTVLRLEDEADWFPCLARKLGFPDLAGEGWRKWKAQPCFFAPSGNCGDAPGAPRAKVVGSVHATDATSKIDDYYDVAAADVARRLYADDFALLGYTLALPGPPCPVPANCYPAT